MTKAGVTVLVITALNHLAFFRSYFAKSDCRLILLINKTKLFVVCKSINAPYLVASVSGFSLPKIITRRSNIIVTRAIIQKTMGLLFKCNSLKFDSDFFSLKQEVNPNLKAQ